MRKRHLEATRAFGWLCAALAFVCGILIIVPFAPDMPRLDLDGAWPFAANVAAGHHLIFGRELVFTVGPLAAVYTRQYYPGSDANAVVAAIFMALAVMLSIIRSTSSDRRPWLLLLPIVMTIYGMTDTIFLLIPWLLVVVAAHAGFRGSPNVLIVHALVCTCALLPLIKGSASLLAVVCIGVTALVLGRVRRAYLITIPVTFLLFLSVAWRFTGQRIPNLPGYFITQGTIVSGYGDAMSVSGGAADAFLFVASACALLGFCCKLPKHVRVPVGAATAIMLFISFKAGMIRHHHESYAACALIVVGVYLFFSLHRSGRVVAFVAGVVPGFIIISQYTEVSPAAIVSRSQDVLVRQLDGAWDRIHGGVELNRQYADIATKIRKDVPIGGEGRSADLYSSDVSALIFSNERWSPRPAFQSYAAYTPELIRLNVNHLRTNAPERIYFQMNPIDHHYPSLEDGASWPWLLGTYRPFRTINDYLVLERVGAPQALPIGKPLIARTVHIGEVVPLPVGVPLWATIDLQPSLGGRVLGALFKRPAVTLHLRFQDGLEESYRFIPGMAITGFLLAPTVRNTTDFIKLWTGDPRAWTKGNTPLSMQLELDSGGAPWWQDDFDLTLAPFPIPAVPKPLPLFDPVEDTSATFESGGQCNIEKLNDVDISGTQAALQGRSATISGWAAIGADMGVSSNVVSLLVHQANGARVLVHTRKMPREDVAIAFHHPSLGHSGYEANLDTSRLVLPARVTVVQELGGVSLECPQRAVTLTGP